LAQIGLSDRAEQPTRQLSGGEAQRVAIATALGPLPAVLLADEVTGELDEAASESVLDMLGSLQSQEGTAVLTVTHNPAVARRAGRRTLMRDGLISDDD
jgi:putative ABC transport system ATP-binding protein